MAKCGMDLHRSACAHSYLTRGCAGVVYSISFYPKPNQIRRYPAPATQLTHRVARDPAPAENGLSNKPDINGDLVTMESSAKTCFSRIGKKKTKFILSADTHVFLHPWMSRRSLEAVIKTIQVRYRKDPHMQNSLRKLKLTLTLILTLIDTGDAVLTLMLGYRSLYTLHGNSGHLR